SVPSGLNATEPTPCPGLVTAGRGEPTGCLVAGFHSRTVPSSPPALASSLPSGLNATDVIAPACPVRGLPIWRWVAGFHSRTAPSPPAVAGRLPSGLTASAPAPPPTVTARRGAPAACLVAGFHSRTYPSSPAVASSLPSGLNATAPTPSCGSAGRGAPVA